MSTASKVKPKQTNRQTRRHYENITSTAYAGGNDNNLVFSKRSVPQLLCGTGTSEHCVF